MRFMVTWTHNAQNNLADIWINAPDRRAVTEASHRIDEALKRDPENLGRPIADDRYYVDPPLVVTFSVSPDDLHVWVWQVERV